MHEYGTRCCGNTSSGGSRFGTRSVAIWTEDSPLKILVRLRCLWWEKLDQRLSPKPSFLFSPLISNFLHLPLDLWMVRLHLLQKITFFLNGSPSLPSSLYPILLWKPAPLHHRICHLFMPWIHLSSNPFSLFSAALLSLPVGNLKGSKKIPHPITSNSSLPHFPKKPLLFCVPFLI